MEIKLEMCKAIEEKQLEFKEKNRRYINNLRGKNDDRYTLIKPNQMPETAKKIIEQLREIEKKYLADNKDKEIVLNEIIYKNEFLGVHRIGNYLGHLLHQEVSEEFTTDIEKSIVDITKLSNYLEEKNIPFMYMQLPCKVSKEGENLPKGVKNTSNIKSTQLVEGLKNGNVNVLDYRDVLIKQDIDFLDRFYKTDTHWKITESLNATKELCREIEKKCDVEIDWSKLEKSSYESIIYKDIFLGSAGKITGIIYSGVDDFELLLPKYDTNYSWECTQKEFYKKGNAKDALLYHLQLDWNYEIVNPYGVYSLVNFGHTIIKNHDLKSDKKILCLNDSFSNPMAMFMASQFAEVHFLDLRGEKKDLKKIIKEVNPSMVIMLYTTFSYNLHPLMTDVNPYE